MCQHYARRSACLIAAHGACRPASSRAFPLSVCSQQPGARALRVVMRRCWPLRACALRPLCCNEEHSARHVDITQHFVTLQYWAPTTASLTIMHDTHSPLQRHITPGHFTVQGERFTCFVWSGDHDGPGGVQLRRGGLGALRQPDQRQSEREHCQRGPVSTLESLRGKLSSARRQSVSVSGRRHLGSESW